MVVLFSSSAKAIDEYASLRSKAAESSDEATKVDPRLETIVERMLNKYAYLCSFASISYLSYYLSYHFYFNLGVLLMESINKLWELQLNVEDWINLRKQSQRVIMFRELYRTVLMSLIPS